MEEERRPLDPTRRMLRVFGVKVTDYEERSRRLLDQLGATPSPEDLLRATSELLDLTSDLNARLKDMTVYLLDLETRVLSEFQDAVKRAAERRE